MIFDSGITKRLTGGDGITVRGVNNKNTETVIPVLGLGYHFSFNNLE